MIEERNPGIAHNAFHPKGCLSELGQATSQLDRKGVVEGPDWPELRRSKRPSHESFEGTGEWQHGWQHCIFRLGFHFWETPCYQASLLRTGRTSGPIQGAMQVWSWHTLPQLLTCLSTLGGHRNWRPVERGG